MGYKSSAAVSRDIVVDGVEMTVFFWFYKGWQATDDEPGAEDELDIEAVFVEDIDIYHLVSSRALVQIEAELFKVIQEGGE